MAEQVFNMKRYEHILNTELGKMTEQEAIDMFNGKAKPHDVSRHYHYGNLGACMRIYDIKRFTKQYLLWLKQQRK